MNHRNLSISTALLLAVTSSTLSASPQAAPNGAAHFNLDKHSLAIDGYDLVAYRMEAGGSAQRGKSAIQLEFDGALYRFATEANRDKFSKNPEHYLPRYGGWCAWAMSKGKQVEIDPKSFLIEGDRLLLFYDGLFNDTRKKWKKQGGASLRPTADANWAGVVGRSALVRAPVASFDTTRAGLGMGGFDPVSFTSGAAPLAGSGEIQTNLGGARYQFANSENRTAFLREPGKYLARFGGHAALALAGGELKVGDPAVFLRQAGGSYFFANAEQRTAWVADPTQVAAAERAWSATLTKLEVGQ